MNNEGIFGGNKIWTPTDVSPEILFSILGILALLIFFVIYLHHRYLRYKKDKVFHEEMEMLEMDETESGTLNEIVKRYTLNEPVELLYSLRLFDEMAEKEMARVLSKPLPIELKKKYVNLLYMIRQKTYFPEGMRSSSPAALTKQDIQSNVKEEQSGSSHDLQNKAIV